MKKKAHAPIVPQPIIDFSLVPTLLVGDGDQTCSTNTTQAILVRPDSTWMQRTAVEEYDFTILTCCGK